MIVRTHEKNCWAKLQGAKLGETVWIDNRKGKAHHAEADWYVAVWVRDGGKVKLLVSTHFDFDRLRERGKRCHIVRAMPAKLRRRCA